MRDKKENFCINIDKVLIILGSISILYYIILKLIFGYIAFSIVFFILGTLLITYSLIEIKFNINIWSMIPKVLKIIISILFIIGITIFISIEGVIVYNGHHFDTEKPEYLMVLGAGLRGNEISTSLKYRLDTAVEYNKKFPDVKIIVSGGQGPGESMTEAEAMKKYLIQKGIDEELIIKEEESTTTYENFLYTKKLLKEHTGEENQLLTVITNNFHMYRAKYLGEIVGFQCLGYPAPAHASSSLNFHVREFFGVIKAYVFKV